MIKLLESFDFMELGRIQSLLEANGVKTFMKNEFLSGALGELPFQEVAPQLFLLDGDDLVLAKKILQETQAEQPVPD